MDGRSENQVKNRFHSASLKAQIPVFKQNKSEHQLFSNKSPTSVVVVPGSPRLTAVAAKATSTPSSSFFSSSCGRNRRRRYRSSHNSTSTSSNTTNTNSNSDGNTTSSNPSSLLPINDQKHALHYETLFVKEFINAMKDKDELISSADSYLAKEKERRKFGSHMVSDKTNSSNLNSSVSSHKSSLTDDVKSNYDLRSTWINSSFDRIANSTSMNSLNDLTDEHSLQPRYIRPKHRDSESTFSSHSLIELLSYSSMNISDSDEATSLTREEASILMDFMNSSNSNSNNNNNDNSDGKSIIISGSRSKGFMKNNNAAINITTSQSTTATNSCPTDTPFSPVISRPFAPFTSHYDGIDISSDDMIVAKTNISWLSDLTERSNSNDDLQLLNGNEIVKMKND